MAWTDDKPDMDNKIGDDVPDIEECLEYLKTQLALKLPLAGGTMGGELAMGANKITGLAAPEDNADAATKAYADLLVGAGGAHANAHTDGTDDIQSATDAQKGVMTAADHVKLTAALTGIKVQSHTRDMTVGNGNVAYDGYGFQPKLLIIHAVHTTSGAVSWASYDGTTARIMGKVGDGDWYYDTNQLVSMRPTAGVYQIAIPLSLDVDGFTLLWAKGGAPAGTATLNVTAIG